MAQRSLSRSFRWSRAWIFTPRYTSLSSFPYSVGLSLGSLEAKFRLEVLRADVGPGSADSCLIARQPTGTVGAFVDRQLCHHNFSCSAVGFSFWRKCSREPSRAVSCKAFSFKSKCGKGMAKLIFLVRRNLNTQKPDDYLSAACDDTIWNGNRMSIHSFERKLSALSNAVSCNVAQRIGRELFDLNARGDIFFLITLYKATPLIEWLLDL